MRGAANSPLGSAGAESKATSHHSGDHAADAADADGGGGGGSGVIHQRTGRLQRTLRQLARCYSDGSSVALWVYSGLSLPAAVLRRAFVTSSIGPGVVRLRQVGAGQMMLKRRPV